MVSYEIMTSQEAWHRMKGHSWTGNNTIQEWIYITSWHNIYIWNYGIMELWNYGIMELWNYGMYYVNTCTIQVGKYVGGWLLCVICMIV